jgi:hypothetical protein
MPISVVVGMVNHIYDPLFVISPVIIGLFVYVLLSVLFWLYNHIAKRVGGIEFLMNDSSDG